MKILKPLYILLCLFRLVYGQTAEITFNVTTANMPPGLPLFICGNQASLADWNPGAMPLNPVNDSLWTIRLTLPVNTTIEYKFTRGSWDTEPFDDQGRPFNNFTLAVTKDTTISHRFEHWVRKAHHFDSTITGTVIHHRNLQYSGLLPRDIHVYLPPGYDKHPKKRYPVLYMHDGQNLFDAATATFTYEWRLDEIADSLIRAGRIEPLIIVGIDNTYQRTAEYSLTETGRKYQNFIVHELKPFIDDRYRTLPGREYTATGGSSLGGLIAFILTWDYNQIFSKALCMSPALKIDEHDLVTPARSYSGPEKDI